MTGRLAVVASLVVLVGACTSAMEPDEYGSAVTATAETYVVESQNLSFDYQQSVEDGVREIIDSDASDTRTAAMDLVRTATVGYLALLEDAMRRYGSALRDLEPPGEVASAHESHIAAVLAVADAVPDARNEVATAPDLEGVQKALTASGFADGQLRWTATCTSLEQAIRDMGHGANLRCTRPVEAP